MIIRGIILPLAIAARRPFDKRECSDGDLADQCLTECRLVYLDCLFGCESEYCSEQCVKLFEICGKSCPCGEDCPDGCIDCDNPICPTATTTTTSTTSTTTTIVCSQKVWFVEQPERGRKYTDMKENCDKRASENGASSGFPAFFRDQNEYDLYLSSHSNREETLGYEGVVGDNNIWFNADGSRATFFDWDRGQPDNAWELCAYINWCTWCANPKKWHDYPCDGWNASYTCRFEGTICE